MFSRNNLRFIVIGAVAVIGYILLALSMAELETFYGIVQFLILLGSMYVIFIGSHLILIELAERIDIKKAKGKTLRREDDLLLQATGFSQSVLWIYLNIIPANEITDAFKIIVPFTASLFFILRGIAKIKEKVKDGNKYRYYSLIVLVFMLANSLVAFLWGFQSLVFLIEGKNVMPLLLIPLYTLVTQTPLGFIRILSKKRYDYVSNWI